MEKIAIVTDSGSGITQSEAKKLGITVIPLPIIIDGETYYDDVNITTDEFYAKLATATEIGTSQPEPGKVMEVWEELLKTHDKIIHMPMSSGLSNACQTAAMLAKEYDGKVIVVDNQRVSVTLLQAILDSLELIAQGKSADEIYDYLMKTKLDAPIFIMVDTLTYLKKGGRITPAAAMLGSLLHIKPILQIKGEKLDAFAKARAVKQAKTIMINALKKEIEENFDSDPSKVHFHIAHTQNEEAAQVFRSEIAAEFGVDEKDIIIAPLSLVIACHTGPGVLATACSNKME